MWTKKLCLQNNLCQTSRFTNGFTEMIILNFLGVQYLLEDRIKVTTLKKCSFRFVTWSSHILQMLMKQMLRYLLIVPWISSLYCNCAINNSVKIQSSSFSFMSKQLWWLCPKTQAICSALMSSFVRTRKSKIF